MRKSKKKNIIISIILGILLIAAAAAGIFSYGVGKQVVEGLFLFNAQNDTKLNSVKQLEIWGYDLDAFNQRFQGVSLTVTAKDGNVIPVTCFYPNGNPNNDNDTVILIHGQGGEHVSVYPLAEIYLNNGMNVITYDQRSSGDSQNPLLTFGHFEKLDAAALAEYARKQAPDKTIVIHGQSMGAATAGLFAGMERADESADIIIMDGSYDNMKNMFLVVWHSMDAQGIPDGYVIACGDWYMKQNYGFVFDDVDVVQTQKNNTIPTLVIAGSRDEISTVEMGTEIYNTIATEKKEMWIAESDHIMALIDYPMEYEQRIMAFIDNYK